MRALLISGRDLAAMLAMQPKTLCAQVAAGKIPPPIRRNGSRPRWQIREITAWIEDDMPSASEWEARKRRHMKGERVARVLAGRDKVQRELADA